MNKAQKNCKSIGLTVKITSHKSGRSTPGKSSRSQTIFIWFVEVLLKTVKCQLFEVPNQLWLVKLQHLKKVFSIKSLNPN